MKAGTGAGIVLDKSRNFALALAAGFEHTYDSDTVDFSPGDLLVLYTDGLVEASDPDEDRFGADRLVDVVAASSRSSAQELVQAISRSLQDFTGGAPPHDDVALLVARRKG
jgi:sigma-B regulation protein RsbU (phosphoserine phosphatase)